ncbi:UDP-N-acetylmuramoyl-tripeptide--D-alanyl-D-alanine ligase [Chloroflexota bacterium]
MRAGAGGLTLADLVAGLADRPGSLVSLPSVEILSTVIDSRQAAPGSLFVALRGQQRDGHEFISDAIAKGAVAVIAERLPDSTECSTLDLRAQEPSSRSLSVPLCILVPDGLAGLQRVASYWRRVHDLRVVGITGSVGKTTTKEVIAAVLEQRYRTLKAEGNYNNEIGLPLTVLNLTGSHEHMILEMGMYDVGEIAQLAEIGRPQVGVVTNVGPTHLERLRTIERIAEAKAELVQALPSAEEGGVAVLNADDPRVQAMRSKTHARVFAYGLDPTADLWADNIESEGLEGIRFQFHYAGESLHVRVPMLGRHSVHTALGAASVGLLEGLSWTEIIGGLQDQTAQLRLVAVQGQHGSTILDDSYNSGPASCIAALRLLGELAGRKIAVLGDMYELGAHEEDGHRMVGRSAGDVVDLLVSVGELARMIGLEAMSSGMGPAQVHLVETNAQAIGLMKSLLEPGDVVLIKGSRGMGMEEIVAALTQSTYDSEGEARADAP